ncbi:MAG: GNAT family N-acetyltransferase [Salinibacter sp.]|uniref:GNAT family N-acetyltransferase n=1 Tax=Salinibacter sp. TaxID=2065818 RepID=UPI0035D42097
MSRLPLPDGLVLSSVEPRDKDALVEHLQAREIWRNTFHIPRPYTQADAEAWIEERIRHRSEQPAETTFAIRTPEGRLIGVVGADEFVVGTSHRARLGYWLAKPYWNRGIMTEAVRRFVDYAFAELEVVRLTAEVFARNEASARVLQKAGFTQEGRLRRHREKDGTLMDVLYFGLLRTDLDDDRN